MAYDGNVSGYKGYSFSEKENKINSMIYVIYNLHFFYLIFLTSCEEHFFYLLSLLTIGNIKVVYLSCWDLSVGV